MSLSSSCDDAAGPRPDIVLVVVDTLRADHLGTYGFGHPSSPHLDRFAEGAVVFERAIAASSRTAPSHASMLTSLWVRDHAIGERGIEVLEAALAQGGRHDDVTRQALKEARVMRMRGVRR